MRCPFSSLTKTLADFRSRCQTLFACKYLRTCSICHSKNCTSSAASCPLHVTFTTLKAELQKSWWTVCTVTAAASYQRIQTYPVVHQCLQLEEQLRYWLSSSGLQSAGPEVCHAGQQEKRSSMLAGLHGSGICSAALHEGLVKGIKAS